MKIENRILVSSDASSLLSSSAETIGKSRTRDPFLIGLSSLALSATSNAVKNKSLQVYVWSDTRLTSLNLERYIMAITRVVTLNKPWCIIAKTKAAMCVSFVSYAESINTWSNRSRFDSWYSLLLQSVTKIYIAISHTHQIVERFHCQPFVLPLSHRTECDGRKIESHTWGCGVPSPQIFQTHLTSRNNTSRMNNIQTARLRRLNCSCGERISTWQDCTSYRNRKRLFIEPF